MPEKEGLSRLWKKEDWWAIWIAALAILLTCLGFVSAVPKIGSWDSNPIRSIGSLLPLFYLYIGIAIPFVAAAAVMKENPAKVLPGLTVVFILAILGFVLARQKGIEAYGLEYPLWGLAVGLLISNTLGTPDWVKAGAKTEFYIKTGLVLLGAEILFNKILAKGAPALFVAWLVTPIVIVFMYLFGTRFLKMTNRALVIVIATATSVCGVTAAIAAAAASKAKKEDLTLAIGMSLLFTVAMMVGMPALVKAVGMDLEVGAAWLGGTIDATGAVVAAGAFLGPEAEKTAAIVKMVQNILIGVVAFAIAVFWVTSVENNPSQGRPSLKEIWIRFPKFILGFIGASLLFSFVLVPSMGLDVVENEILGQTKNLRAWLFCMGFVSIGLESNFKELASQMVGGKPIVLYVVGQTFNIVLTLLAAYLAFGGILFPRTVG
jgi:uncharacterized integral membrane protein (TIGR00698 family)